MGVIYKIIKISISVVVISGLTLWCTSGNYEDPELSQRNLAAVFVDPRNNMGSIHVSKVDGSEKLRRSDYIELSPGDHIIEVEYTVAIPALNTYYKSTSPANLKLRDVRRGQSYLLMATWTGALKTGAPWSAKIVALKVEISSDSRKYYVREDLEWKPINLISPYSKLSSPPSPPAPAQPEHRPAPAAPPQ